MKYVFDNNTITTIFRFYYFDRFPSFWKNFDTLVKSEEIISVREVRRELEYKKIDVWTMIKGWSNNFPDFFSNPTNEELEFIKRIFRVKHFQQNIGQRNLYQGKPVADPFVVARAKVNGLIVVTQEKYKDKASGIPNMCEHFQIDYVDLKGFLVKENWEF